MHTYLVFQGSFASVYWQGNLKRNAYAKPLKQFRILNRGSKRSREILRGNIRFIFPQKHNSGSLTSWQEREGRHRRWWWTYQWTYPTTQSEVETRLSRTKLLRRAIERCFQPTPHPSQRATLGAAHSLDPFQFITHSPTCIILPATHFLLVSGGKFIGWGILTPFTF